MGAVLLVIVVITAYGADTFLRRLPRSENEAELAAHIVALKAGLASAGERAAAVEKEVAALCEAVDADDAEFAKLRSAGSSTASSSASDVTAGLSQSELEVATGLDKEQAAVVQKAREEIEASLAKAAESSRNKLRFGVLAGLVGGVMLGSVL